jgi:hypothetical protein
MRWFKRLLSMWPWRRKPEPIKPTPYVYPKLHGFRIEPDVMKRFDRQRRAFTIDMDRLKLFRVAIQIKLLGEPEPVFIDGGCPATVHRDCHGPVARIEFGFHGFDFREHVTCMGLAMMDDEGNPVGQLRQFPGGYCYASNGDTLIPFYTLSLTDQ